MAVVNPSVLEWRLSERHFAGNGYDGHLAPLLYTQEATHPLILTAVHAVNHYRDAEPKVADVFTGSLALLLAERVGCNVGINTHKNPAMNCAWGTPAIEHWLMQRVAILEAPYVLDIHGAKDNETFDVALGTGGAILPTQEAWLNRCIPALEQAGLRVALNVEGYAALSPRSLTARIRAQDLPLTPLQIEITRRWRSPEEDLARANHLLCALHQALGT